MADFEKAIIDAIVNQFFAPTPDLVLQPDGTTQPRWNLPQAWYLASSLFEKNREAIFVKIEENLDLDKLATEIAEKVVKDLKTPPGDFWHGKASDALRKKIDDLAIEKVAQIKAEELIAEMKKEQE